MKKVLIGLGIGCGALILLVVVATVGLGMWAKGKVKGMVEAGEQMEEQQSELKALDKKYPFTPPPKGQPLKIDDDRLTDYLAIRAGVAPVFKSFEEKSKDFEKRNRDKKSLSAGLEAMGMVGELFRQVRAAHIEQLDAQKMSPTEYHSITAAIYTSHIGKGMAQMQRGQREALEKQVAELEQRMEDESLSDQERELIEKQIEAMEQQLESLPAGDAPSADLAVHEANAALLDKYKVQIEKEANPALDIFLLGSGEELGKAFERAGFPGK
ncbi:MAG: hypothetical protein HYZ28_05010 [Myxococcales bacterium]|nr:hypothetical protein [Myxococcales bacterium]